VLLIIPGSGGLWVNTAMVPALVEFTQTGNVEQYSLRFHWRHIAGNILCHDWCPVYALNIIYVANPWGQLAAAFSTLKILRWFWLDSHINFLKRWVIELTLICKLNLFCFILCTKPFFSYQKKKKNFRWARHWWLTPVILAAEIWRIEVPGQTRQIVLEISSPK
jgi:hypothetical protein